METDLFFGSESIELAAHILEAVYDVVSTPPGSSFKGHVLPEMRQAKLVRRLVAAADIEDKAAMRYFGMGNLLVYNSDAVGQGMQVKVRH